MIRARNKNGSMITFATALLMAFVVLGLGFLAFLMYMGGQSETKNAVDAGTLNVGKQALDKISVNLSLAGNQRIYADVASDEEKGAGLLGDNKINLRRINRVWAKAMVIAINAEDARRLGAAGSGPSNASQAVAGATAISNQLATKLKNQTNLHGFFREFTSRNSVRMLGNTATVKVLAGSNWQTSLMERGSESNIVLPGGPPFKMPPNFNLNRNYTTKSTRQNVPQSGRNLWFLRGYTPIRIGNRTFWQVPFTYDSKPHLVSRSTFDSEKQSTNPLGWNNAVPNSFSAQGEAGQRGSVAEKATSWVLTNPRQPYKLAIPHSFVHIQLDQMKANWKFFPVGPPIRFRTTNYNYIPRSQSTTMPLGGVGCSTVGSGVTIIGTEVAGRTVDDIIFGMPRGNTGRLESYLVNRINEMTTKVGKVQTARDLHNCLGAFETRAFLAAARGKTDFYIYSPDGEKIVCKPRTLAMADVRVPWLATKINNRPDGTERTFVNNAKQPMIIGSPLATVIPLPFFVPTVRAKWGTFHKDVYFKPGTGYNGNLGTVRVKRWTDVFSLGVSVPI